LALKRISFLSLVKNCNHKRLGIYYLLSAFIFGISGTLISVLMRIELYSSGNRIISPENQNFYNVSISLHGLLMIFFLVMPGLFGGFGNYLLVIFQGSPEVVYPRVNNLSILILFLSYLLLILSLISEFGAGTGWTLYPPLSTSFMSLSPSSTANLILGLLVSGISSCLTSLNFLITILNLRSYCLTLKTMPLFPWALLITAAMLLLTLPVLSGGLLMVLSDLQSNTLFFDPVFGGDPVLYQHLFWFFGHPEVYILIIPAFGIISIIISGVSQKLIFGNQSMIFAMSCISLLGSVVWGHHMYTIGLEADTRAYFTGVTILISLPTGTKIFNWLSTYLGNLPFLSNGFNISSALFALLFLLMFTIGGSTGVILGNAAVDIALHDTYYVVAHFHFVLSLGAVIAIFSAIIFNGENILGSKSLLPSSSSFLSLYHLVLTFVGILLTFSPMHFLGFNVMPRRIPDFPDSFHSWNFLSSIGSGITFISFAIFYY
jgi:heme/copper-type cytochrome/quinol oxidase subunit 1